MSVLCVTVPCSVLPLPRLRSSVAQGRAGTLQEILKRVAHSSEDCCVERVVDNCQLQIAHRVFQ